MSISIRKGRREDVADTLSLIKELAEYEKALDKVLITEGQLLKEGFGERPWFWLLVAEKEGEIIGVAFYFFRYSTWKGRLLYLEDFVVKEKHRGSGIGTMLFDELIRIGKAEQVHSIVWQVLEWNEPAIKFYDKYKAEISNEWRDGILEII